MCDYRALPSTQRLCWVFASRMEVGELLCMELKKKNKTHKPWNKILSQ